MSNLRLIAARVIDEVTEGRSLTECLEQTLPTLKDSRDRGFVQALCYGVCRFYTHLDIILSRLLQKPMKAKDGDVHALLLVGLYQLKEMRVPPHAAVAETVNAVSDLKKDWARGLVNAVLREYIRSGKAIEEEMASDPESFYAHPDWWIEQIKAAWGEQWQAILYANNAHPPLALRVNQRQHSREDYLQLLQEQGHAAEVIPETKSGLLLKIPISAESLPGFSAGDVSVQDGAAQLAAECMELAPGLRVLDACAAPGNKLTHMVEIEPDLAGVVAVEHDKIRMISIQENLTRLKLNKGVRCIHGDAAETAVWWDGEQFDRILLDAPCSASGVIRRHPDIKLLRQPGDIKQFAREQMHLLSSLWPLLKPGGLLLYVTCSIFPQENTQVIEQFVAMQQDAKPVPVFGEQEVGLVCGMGSQVLPGMHNMDGFYFAKLRKES